MDEPSPQPDYRLNDASIVDYRCRKPSWAALNRPPGCLVSARETLVDVMNLLLVECKLAMRKTKHNITRTVWNLPSKIPIHKLKLDQKQEWNSEATAKNQTAYIYSPVSPRFTFFGGTEQRPSFWLHLNIQAVDTPIFTPFSCREICFVPSPNHQKGIIWHHQPIKLLNRTAVNGSSSVIHTRPRPPSLQLNMLTASISEA